MLVQDPNTGPMSEPITMVSLMRRITVLSVCLAFLVTALVAAPTQAATYIESPCRITVPSKVTLSSKKTTKVTAKITSCPAGALNGYIYWDWENLHTKNYSFSFTYDGSAIYKYARMTTSFYSWDAGTYRLTPSQEDYWISSDHEYKFALLSNTPALTAKLASSVSLKGTGKGKSRKLSITAKRHRAYDFGNASGKVTVKRNGKKWKTVSLRKGKASVKLPGKTKARWQASIGETGIQWGASSKTIRR